ncbi:hypothetical protein GRZ55_10920 [Chelativorans sp. ZYF759]|uniref:hypothetical protein n=1 Tax=Chelativorans sp. ZYF759 TaxID=2692213 RepID=UPI0016AEE504|nr:hypothetical protein [Chelativorans sp. ZYF759]NMG39754.1 hypothetical protein [Chelativorans sp. ZYF759]
MSMVRTMKRVLVGPDVDREFMRRIGKLTLDELEDFDEFSWRAFLPLGQDALDAWEESRQPTIDA